MKRLIAIFVLFAFPMTNFGQVKTIEEVRKELKAAVATFKGKKPKYYFKNELKNKLSAFDSTDIVEIKALSLKESKELFGKNGENGVIAIIANQFEQSSKIYGEALEVFPLPMRMEQPKEDPDKIYEKVEVEAAFYGNFNKYLISNLQYPEKAKNEGIEGEVIMHFLVEKDGSCEAIKVSDYSPSKNPDFVKEATRLISKIGKEKRWMPGIQNGNAVRSYHEQNITFKLPGFPTDKDPTYPNFDKEINTELKKIQLLEKDSLVGKVTLLIRVDAKGNVAGVEVKDYFGQYNSLLSRRAVETIFTTSGKWKPGTHRGKPAAKTVEKTISFK